MSENKPTKVEIQKVEYTVHGLLEREYKSNDSGDTYEEGFDYGISDGFALALRGLFDQAFPRGNER